MATQAVSQTQWWRLPRVEAETGLSKATIYRRIAQGTFPKNHALRSTRAKVWLESDVRAWKDAELVDEGLGGLL